MRNVWILGMFGFAAMVAQAGVVYQYDFHGTVSGEQFISPPAALASISAGDPFDLNFNMDSGTGRVFNIDAMFMTRGIELTSGAGSTQLTSYTLGFPNEYRWDYAMPDFPGFTMVFWFRTNIPGVVHGGVPPAIDVNQFNYLHEFDIIRDFGGGGPPTINVSLDNVPEPATMGLTAVPLTAAALALVMLRRKRATSPRP